jgi:Amt family ammonium transporter
LPPDTAGTSFSEATTALCLVYILLIPFAAAGLALINTGLSRSRSATHSILSCLYLASVGVLVYFVCGCAWLGFKGDSFYTLDIAGKSLDWIAAESLFLRRVTFDGGPASLQILFQLFVVPIACLIPASAVAERWRLAAAAASTALLAGWIFPLFAHWVWGNGWLAQLGPQFGLGSGFTDTGGASSIHVVGALTGLALLWILGPRRGRFTTEGIPTAMPGHNAVIVLFGCFLALVGFAALNSAGSILFTGTMLGETVRTDVNTLFCGTAAALAAMAVTRLKFGRPDASLTANGFVAGLVASSATCAVVKPAESALIGFIAGALVIYAIELLELRVKLDDPSGAIAVHGAAGVWGILAAGIFAGSTGQLLAQLIGIATLVGAIFPLTYTANWLLNRVLPQRVSAEGEKQGMDLSELGAGAYPEFVTHREDFLRRP